MSETLLTAIFSDQTSAIAAWRDLREEAEAQLHSPMPVDGIEPEECSTRAIWISRLAGIAAAIAFAGSIAFQWWSAHRAYPIDIGGRPLNLLTYMPAAIAVAMLAGGLIATVSFLRFAGLPRLHHAFFEGEGGRAVAEGNYVVTLLTQAPEAIEPRLRSHGPTRVDRHEIADG